MFQFPYFLKQAATSTQPQPVESSYKLKHTFTERQRCTLGCRKASPDLIPTIIENSGGVPALDKKKFLIIQNLTWFQLKTFIMMQLKKKSQDTMLQASTLIMTVGKNGYLPTSSEVMKDLYETYKDEDGFLYIVYTMEVSFG